MAGSRVPIVFGILAIASGITWFALRGDQRSGDLTPTVRAGSGSASGKAAIFAPEGPSLGSGANAFEPPPGSPRPALGDAPAPSHRDVFAAQTRDPAWATRIEGEIQDRVRTLPSVQRVECRADQCELTLSGPADTVEATIATLEGPTGLSPLAKSLLLGGPERSGDSLTLRVYALFEPGD